MPSTAFPRRRAEIVDELRRLVARGVAPEARALPFGLPAIDAHLPQGGLSCGALHEIIPEARADTPAAFGFMAATLSLMPRGVSGRGPLLLVTSPCGLAAQGRPYGHPYGHGLNGFGLDPARIILVEAPNATQALWAMEEALRSAVPTAVAGVIGKLDFRASQRLHLAAGESGRPLLLLRPPGTSSVAVTRWRIAAAAAAHDRFGLIARWRWQVRLERCRNGRLGQWIVEFDHATHRFSLAAALADPALSHSTGTDTRARSHVYLQAG
jgi:protein ImuA